MEKKRPSEERGREGAREVQGREEASVEALSPPSQPLHRRGGRWAERRAPSHGELDREAGAGGRRRGGLGRTGPTVSAW